MSVTVVESSARRSRRTRRRPAIGFVSLGCAKALVDSERILTRLRAEGYAIAASYREADLVVVNTCGFLLSARAESFEAIGEALAENGKVVVTGCLGAEAERIREAFPRCWRSPVHTNTMRWWRRSTVICHRRMRPISNSSHLRVCG